jgi:hypothetical protein
MATPIKIKFKHHPSPPTSGCTVPFGICIIIPIGLANNVTSEEYNEGFGIALCDIVDGKFHLVFQRRAALDDGTVPIQDYWNLGEEVSKKLGFDEVVVRPGRYNVNFSNYREFGEALFDADFS